jgi:hypothetical protein
MLRSLLDEQIAHDSTPASPPPQDEAQLANLFIQALFGTQEARWEDVFVSPQDYARLVRIEPHEARRFVDELLSQASSVWRAFGSELPSELPEGGLSTLFTVEQLRLGAGRTLSGKIATQGQPVVQHWGNVLVLKLTNAPVLFEIHLPKILRLPEDQNTPARLAIAGPIRLERRLELFLEAGLHLKPELMRSQEYPYPLSVGNFWRYRRLRPQEKRIAQSEDERILQELSASEDSFEATEVLQEVLHIERYGPMRLVKLRWSYNDQSLTKIEQSWLVTPRRIYLCQRACLKKIEDLDWLLKQLPHEPALFSFDPSRRSSSRLTRDVEVPAGLFIAAHISSLQKNAAEVDPFIKLSSLERAFAPGRGLVRQQLRGTTSSGESITIVVELVESRIMP